MYIMYTIIYKEYVYYIYNLYSLYNLLNIHIIISFTKNFSYMDNPSYK